jgi:putative flavoprotein involved in K+ transport
MKRTETLIIGGGQAGLAMSRCLTDRAIDHVVIEKGRVGERWRSQRWDSLRLLTPNWQSRLPGWSYRGPNPDGFMTKDEVIGYLEGYARSFSAPVESGVTVVSVEKSEGGFRVDTDRGSWLAASVVVATGQCDRPHIPGFGARLSRDVRQVVPSAYRKPEELPRGGVLVVGASATGIQLAEEIHRAGRPVTLSVGRHTRLPRRYRGRDIQWWLDAAGIWKETHDDVRSLEAARQDPSLQLIGSPHHRTLDLGILQEQGVRLVGRAVDADDGRIELLNDLPRSVATADAKLIRLLRRIDEYVDRAGLSMESRTAGVPSPVTVSPGPDSIDLSREGIGTVVWATGYRRAYPWLRVPVLDSNGEVSHDGGVTAVPGLYVLGLQFLRTRKSSFLDGVGDDAVYLADHIASRRTNAGRMAA